MNISNDSPVNYIHIEEVTSGRDICLSKVEIYKEPFTTVIVTESLNIFIYLFIMSYILLYYLVYI
jgi:hypothetical protein